MKKCNTFSKQERLCGTKQVDMLFSSGNRQIAVFPVRLVWLLLDDARGVRILVSAPKRHFRHAVDRNRIKRQIREYYRVSSAPIREAVDSLDKGLALAFLFTDNRIWDTGQLWKRLDSARDRLVAALPKSVENNDCHRQE